MSPCSPPRITPHGDICYSTEKLVVPHGGSLEHPASPIWPKGCTQGLILLASPRLPWDVILGNLLCYPGKAVLQA